MNSFEEIDSLKPLAESRGYTVSSKFRRGVRYVGLDKHVGDHDGGGPWLFAKVEEAQEFLNRRPELPRYKIQATYACDHTELFEFYEVDRCAALMRGAIDADIMVGLLPDLDLTLKSVEIL